MNETDEFSFKLQPSGHGVGVFAVESIKKGTYLRLFGDRNKEGVLETRTRPLTPESVPTEFRDHCIFREGKLICPLDFGEMAVGWYLNHSGTPNARRDESYRWYALADINAGDEITIDYNSLEEPEETKEPYQ